MSEVDNFILRWARLKRASDAGHQADPSGDKPLESTETVVAGAEAAATLSRIDAAAVERFDLASLPSVEAIAADTDVRGFLQSGVPAELTRAALRRAWTSDPAIRDFVGIAENQWDFNDPNAIPGFGPLPATENLSAVLTQALGMRDERAEMISDMLASVDRSLPAATGHERADSNQSDRQTFDGSPSNNDGVRGVPDDGSEEDKATKNNPFAKGDGLPLNCRSHGSALPR
ncbi:MAG: DUF3306 domain-containing protein [Xanthobacteraceae bacterium]